MAAFAAQITDYNTEFKYAFFDISDCNRKVSLNFDYENAEEKQNCAYKLDKLIEELTKFKEALLK